MSDSPRRRQGGGRARRSRGGEGGAERRAVRGGADPQAAQQTREDPQVRAALLKPHLRWGRGRGQRGGAYADAGKSVFTSRGSLRSAEEQEEQEQARLEAERKLEELKRRRDDAESGEFERMRQKQQEAEAELEELKRKREERRKVLEEEERQRKQEEAERKAKEEVQNGALVFLFFPVWIQANLP